MSRATLLIVLGATLWIAGCSDDDASVSLRSNLAPQVTTPADQTADANSTVGPLTVEIADDNTDPSELTFTASASDPELIQSIETGGSGSSRTITIVPAANALGSARVAIVVGDGDGLTTLSGFDVEFTLISTQYSQFVRDVFVLPADGEPVSIEVLAFDQDGAGFDDLIAP